jgi:hypothetical protein
MVILTEESLVLQVWGWAQGQPPSPGKIQLLKSINQRMPDGSMDKDQSELNGTQSAKLEDPCPGYKKMEGIS